MYVILRLFAICPNAGAAHKLQAQVSQTLVAFAPQCTARPKRDWRDAGRFELSLRMFPDDRSTFDQLVALVPAGWMLCGDADDASAVWNPVAGHVLLDPRIVWAEVISSAHGRLDSAGQ